MLHGATKVRYGEAALRRWPLWRTAALGRPRLSWPATRLRAPTWRLLCRSMSLGAQSRRSAPAMVSSEQSFSPDAAGEVVVDQLPAEAAKDRRACRASRPRPHFPVGRGRGQRPEGACHPCRHPLPSSATAMDVNAIQAKQNESGTAGLSDVVNNKAVGPMPTPAGRYELPNSGHSRGRWHLPMRETLV